MAGEFTLALSWESAKAEGWRPWFLLTCTSSQPFGAPCVAMAEKKAKAEPHCFRNHLALLPLSQYLDRIKGREHIPHLSMEKCQSPIVRSAGGRGNRKGLPCTVPVCTARCITITVTTTAASTARVLATLCHHGKSSSWLHFIFMAKQRGRF